jgi:cell wall-associated NlpC family hydrolase
LALCGLAACSSQPHVAPQSRAADTQAAAERHQVVETALAQLNKPYRYGGHSGQGFDCSGLVYYAYQSVGIAIPRTARAQQRSARAIPLQDLSPGDLLFFRERGGKPSHVGLYVGKNRFIHASTSRQTVMLSSLANPYWKERLISAGRYSEY